MRVVFLGVGEAADELLPNTSVWLRAEGEGGVRSVLLDCGFTVPPQYWRQTADPEDLDALWISHFHGDHFFGTPLLLLRFWEMKRQKPLVIVGQEGTEDMVNRAMDLAYARFRPKLMYPLKFVTAEAGETLELLGLQWRFAENGHGQRDLAVRVDDGKHSVFYSGDGLPTPETLDLAQSCSLVVHEAFRLNGGTPGHGSVMECIEFARRAGARTLALVHVQRDERRMRRDEILTVIESVKDVRVILPEPGEEWVG